jgi:hypothetical protein
LLLKFSVVLPAKYWEFLQIRHTNAVFSTAFELRGADLSFFSCSEEEKNGEFKKNICSAIEV